jgi:hypothetical protein
LPSINPEVFGEEIEHNDPKIVAESKGENVRRGMSLSGETTATLSWDAVTLYNGWDNLSRLIRQIPEPDPDRSAEDQWQHIDYVLEKERKIMKDRFTQRPFFIRWQVAIALCSADESIQRTAVLFIEKMFEPIPNRRVNRVFKLNSKLKKMREEGIVPTRQQLAEGVKAFFFGPGMPFAEMPGKKDEPVVVYNKGFEDKKYVLGIEALIKLIRNTALPAHLMLALLAGQDMGAPIEEGEEQPDTFYLDLSAINDYGTIQGDYATI